MTLIMMVQHRLDPKEGFCFQEHSSVYYQRLDSTYPQEQGQSFGKAIPKLFPKCIIR
jgi:hypothetical protein